MSDRQKELDALLMHTIAHTTSTARSRGRQCRCSVIAPLLVFAAAVALLVALW